jgi:5-methylthioadenosine/S-adenosylhomocysteine deaminase
MNRSNKLFAVTIVFAATAFSGSIKGSSRDCAKSCLPYNPSRGLVIRGTIVTMDNQHTVVDDGNVLVRNDRIVAIWHGQRPPFGTPVGDAEIVDFGPSALIFPGMINLHDHPTFDMLRLWPAPSSDVQVALGRPLGTEPYADRYQWNDMLGNSSPEFRRLVESPQLALALKQGLNLNTELVKYAKVKALVGGETTLQGAIPSVETDGLLARNAESVNFGRQRIQSRVPSIASFIGAPVADLLTQMRNGQVDAWLVHLAEGVPDGDRRPGDPTSVRSEFILLKSKGLLTDMTVIVHGTGLERQDFAEMRAAQSIRSDGSGDGLGAELVWSPLSNLLLYGLTTNVYEALAAGVLVSLGTDWSPSGSRNLLDELKVADIALRDPIRLGRSRSLVPELSVEGKRGWDAEEAERTLDRLLVEMVTRNPAKTLRWQDEVGSIEAGKVADILVITKPSHVRGPNLPSSPYRRLIDATERDVRLVLVAGDPVVGDRDLMDQLKPGQDEPLISSCDGYQKAAVVTKAGVPKGDETFADVKRMLNDGLVALGGDKPPPGGGPADLSNTYSYLKQHFTLPFSMTDQQFMQLVLIPTAGIVGGKLNLERLTLTPLFTDEDEFFFDVLGDRINATTGLLDDPTPPFKLYPSNENQLEDGVNPFAPEAFEYRWYRLPNAREEHRNMPSRKTEPRE